jgi:hypothetical protein
MALKKNTLRAYDWASVIADLNEHNPPDGFVTTFVTIQLVPQEGYSIQIVVEDALSIKAKDAQRIEEIEQEIKAVYAEIAIDRRLMRDSTWNYRQIERLQAEKKHLENRSEP